jgi:hypothetical protein
MEARKAYGNIANHLKEVIDQAKRGVSGDRHHGHKAGGQEHQEKTNVGVPHKKSNDRSNMNMNPEEQIRNFMKLHNMKTTQQIIIN